MKIALVHDQLQEFGGAERVLYALHEIFPDAPVYTAFQNSISAKKNLPQYETWDIRESWASKIPWIGKLYSPLRFLAPLIWESFDFSSYDIVLSSSGWYMCKGIKTRKPTLHLSYVHHPPRYLYGYETAVEWQKYWPVKIYALMVNAYLRRWDYISSQRPDILVANSEETRRRIAKLYHRDSVVIYPPVVIPPRYESETESHDYYITVSRLAKAKHIDLLIRTANKHRWHLKIVGSGRDLPSLQAIAGETIEFVTQANDQLRNELLRGAKAFLFASVDEEFGIAPIEAMGSGTPVIALKSGGLIETVHDGINGYLFDRLSEDSVHSAVEKLERLTPVQYRKMRTAARKESEQYSFERFKNEVLALVEHSTKTP